MADYDLIVIGAGAGGITAGFTAAGFGKRVLLVDRAKPGGECTWSGCVPSKALIYEAARVHTARELDANFTYDSAKALAHVHRAREEVYSHEDPDALAKGGIDFMSGTASFIDSQTIRVGDQELRSKRFVICTGTSPFVPPIPGLAETPHLTNESIFELDRLPKSMIVLGGGPIGVELAQALERLGTHVDLVEMMPSILPREEAEFAAAVQARIASEGVTLHLGSKATEVSGKEGGVTLTCEKDGSQSTVKAAGLLVAIGRKPNIEALNLEAVGVETQRTGILTDATMRTSARSIYAAGDVVGPYQFSHMANAQAIIAAQNAILPINRKISYDHVPWVTFTEPELARAGMTEAEARERHGDSIRIYDVDMNELDRTRTGGPSEDRIKLVLDRKGRVLGATILAERAGEMIGEIQTIKKLGIRFRKLAGVIHPYPTYAEVFQKIGKRVLVDDIFLNPIVKLFRKGGS
jgi:pyruvate/2-oxoglutarate dehydrogenase complex dihydrolipoamide dehydrogenase (E3) component